VEVPEDGTFSDLSGGDPLAVGAHGEGLGISAALNYR
jgi:hypothetical protein